MEKNTTWGFGVAFPWVLAEFGVPYTKETEIQVKFPILLKKQQVFVLIIIA